jgi:sugar lactone lactonase YvrE
MRVAVDTTSLLTGAPEVFLDLTAEALTHCGAIFDDDGRHRIALWGAGTVRAYAPGGTPLRQIEVPATHATCPAFGGADLSNLYVTSARQGISDAALRAMSQHGMTFTIRVQSTGVPEPK